jgi:glc operon protein GlcG
MQTYSELGEAEARLAIDAAVAELKKRGKAAVIAVGDRHGELIALWRMDGALLPAAGIATNKVFTSARVRGLSGDLGRSANAEGWDVHYHGDARYVGWDGGVAVIRDGVCLGAVGVSGMTGVEDLAVAQIAVDAILAHME